MKLMSLVPAEPIEKNTPIELTHVCQLQNKADLVEILIPGNKMKDRIKRWIIRKCILSRNHPFAKSCIRSTARINNEIEKHINKYHYTIYPFSEFRNLWELFMAFFLFISLIFIPYIIAFHFNEPHRWIYILFIINLFFILDTLLYFFTGYFDVTSRIVILDRSSIIKKYFNSFFIFDLISALPVHSIFILMSFYHVWDWYWTIFNLVKMVRIRNLVVYFRNLSQLYGISFQTYKILEMSTILILCIHWATCLELYVPLVGEKIDWTNPNRSIWLNSEYTLDATSKVYIICMSRATISIVASSHFRDMKTTEDLILNMFLTVFGRIGFIYILAQLSMLMTTLHSTKKKIVKSLQELHQYMQYKQLPSLIQQRIVTYYTYWSNRSYKMDRFIISNVSPNLQQEILMHNYKKLMASVEFFKILPRSILSQIVLLFKPEIYLATDVLVKFGTIGDAVYYIESGTVAVYSEKGEKICHLEDGSYFGETALVMENEKRLATIIAIETCEVHVLKRADFIQILKPYPYLINQLQKMTIEKLEKCDVVEILHKYWGPMATDIDILKSDHDLLE